MMAVEAVTGGEDKFFELKPEQIRTRAALSDSYNTKLILGFIVSQDVTMIQRDVYNSFMLLGDVGGLQGILFSVGAAIVGLFTYNNSDNNLAKSLYVPFDEEELVSMGKKTKENELNPRKQYAFKEYLQEILPSCCSRSGCLKPNRRDRVFVKAREKLSEELDLVKLIQRLRVLETTIKSMVPQDQLLEIKSQSKRLALTRLNKHSEPNPSN